MLSLIKFELKKMLLRPLSLILLFIILGVNVTTIFLDSGGNIIQRKDMEMQRIEKSKYASEINQSWTSLIQTELQEIRENPENMMSKEEKKEAKQEYNQRGYTKEYIDSLDDTAFLKQEIITSLPYNILIGAEYSSKFYKNAQKYSIMKGDIYRTEFKGKKGETLATKAEGMYDKLAQHYTAYYDYNLGWNKINYMQNLMPFTVGLFLLVTLSSIFSGEYSQRTDSFLLSSKYGKSKLIHAKVIAVFLMTIGFWLIIQIINLLLIAKLYNLQGAQTFVQDWVFNNSPFAFTQLTNYLSTTLMSFIGALFFAAVVLLISAKTKSPFVTLLVSGVILMFPVMQLSKIGGLMSDLLPFMPSNILIAAEYFTFFNAYYIFGEVVLMQYAVPTVALVLSVLMVLITQDSFKKRQVEN
jgi:ABC-type transport system involved in multi-copper enzyme maturation permease subunit